MQHVTVLIPCYNEESGIAEVLGALPREKLRHAGYELRVIVIDNNCTDKTAEVAQRFGAEVVCEEKRGKGNAMRRGFQELGDTNYVVMLDGDSTYRPEEMLRMLEPLSSGFATVVVGSRLGGKISDGSMRGLNRAGNWMYSHLVRYFYRVNVTDVLTGYFAWTAAAARQLAPHLESEGFALEMEMVTKMARLGEDICCVPISYQPRKGESSLRPLYDGARILAMFAQNLFWDPPLPQVQRIAFVSDAVMPYFHGGKERRLYEISRRLVRPDREVHIYTMQWWQGSKTIVHDGVYFHALCKHYPLYNGARRSMREAIMFSLATFKLLFTQFDVLDVDHMPYFPLMSLRLVTWLKGKKMYATWHEVWGVAYWCEYMSGWKGYVGALVERVAFHLPDVIITNSQHTTKRLRAAGVRAPINTIPLGVDLEHIYNAKAASLRSDVIFVGRLLAHKNADVLVRAIAHVKEELSDVVCYIVGDGPQKALLRQLIADLSLTQQVFLFDEVQSNELYGLMKASKMLVLPSVREGFGLVAVEAHAAGLPVITTAHSDNAAKDLIYEGVNGYLAEPTPQSIAQRILQIYRERERMRPQEYVEQYDWRIVAADLERAQAGT